MERLFRVLKKPNRLDEYADSDKKGILWYLTNTRSQILILHRLGQIYVTTFCLLVCWSSVTLGLPVLYSEDPKRLQWLQLLMKYICFCIVSNYFLVAFHAKKSHYGFSKAADLPLSTSNLKGHRQAREHLNASENGNKNFDWTKCSHCDIEVPPRARHCAICQTCVLKKDHHCFFTGCCIGFYNQRYFIIFCFFGIVGGSWGIYNLGTYLSANYSPFFSLQIYNYFLPVCFILCAFGYTTLFDAFLVLLFYLHITSTATSYYYFSWEMLIIYRGQTSYECIKRKKIYSDNFSMNMRSVFGPYWIVGFLFPVPFANSKGDGMSWTYKKKAW